MTLAVSFSDFNTPIPSINDRTDIMFTSGSTGRPKGVIVPQRGPLNFMLAAAVTLQVELPSLPFPLPPHLSSMHTQQSICGADVRGCTNGAITFDLSLADLLFPLVVGGQVEVMGNEIVRNMTQWVERMEGSGVTCLWATPSVLTLLTDLSELPNSIKSIHNGKSGCPPIKFDVYYI